ncbi:MAG: HEAT repeat domain-containing protein [Fuerstiella sp.]
MRLSTLMCLPVYMIITVALQPYGAEPLFGQENSRNPPVIAALVQHLESGSSAEKLDAATRLGHLGPYASHAVSGLAKALTSGDPALQYEILVALGHIGPLATESIDEVAAVLSSDILPLRTAALDTLRQIGTVPPAVAEEVEDLATSSNDAVMTAAVRCLVTMERENSAAVAAAVPGLVKALGNQRASVRNAAANALVEIGESIVPSLKTPLGSDQAVVRRKSCEVAGRLGVAASGLVPLLVARLSDENKLVVRSAASALGEVGSNAELVLPKLQPLLVDDSASVRAIALSALAEFGPLAQKTIPAVCGMVNDDSTIVRAAAARALGQIGEGSEEAVHALMDAIDDPHGGVTIQAANSLSQLGATGVPALIRLLDKPHYRDLAVTVLGEIGPAAKTAVPALVALLKSDNEQLRRESFIALATIGPEATAAVPALLKILRDPEAGSSRGGAAYVLGHIGEQTSIPVLKKILSGAGNTEAKVLRAAAWALVMLQPDNSANAPIVLPYLTEALSSEVPLARKEALAAIGQLGAGGQPASDALLALAKNDPEMTVRSEALHALALLPDISDEVLPIAIVAMDNHDPQVRNSARFLLGKMGASASVAAAKLKRGTREGAAMDRIVAAWALARVAPSDEHNRLAVPFMLQALPDHDPRVRAEAAHTLGLIGISRPEVIDALRIAASDQDKNVANAAKTALEQLN